MKKTTISTLVGRGSSGVVASSRRTALLVLSTRVRGTLLAVRPAVRLAARMAGGFHHCCGDSRHASLPGPAGTPPSEVGLSPYAASWAGGRCCLPLACRRHAGCPPRTARRQWWRRSRRRGGGRGPHPRGDLRMHQKWERTNLGL